MVHVAGGHVTPRLALAVIDGDTLAEGFECPVEVFVTHIATSEGEPCGWVVVADSCCVLEALCGPGEVFLVEIVPS